MSVSMKNVSQYEKPLFRYVSKYENPYLDISVSMKNPLVILVSSFDN